MFEVDAVDPDIHVVAGGQVPLAEPPVVLLPYRREPRDVGRTETGRVRRRSNQTTGDIHYVVTGAGGALREARPDNADYRFKGVSARSLLDAWATERHFLLVEVDRKLDRHRRVWRRWPQSTPSGRAGAAPCRDAAAVTTRPRGTVVTKAQSAGKVTLAFLPVSDTSRLEAYP